MFQVIVSNRRLQKTTRKFMWSQDFKKWKYLFPSPCQYYTVSVHCILSIFSLFANKKPCLAQAQCPLIENTFLLLSLPTVCLSYLRVYKQWGLLLTWKQYLPSETCKKISFPATDVPFCETVKYCYLLCTKGFLWGLISYLQCMRLTLRLCLQPQQLFLRILIVHSS